MLQDRCENFDEDTHTPLFLILIQLVFSHNSKEKFYTVCVQPQNVDDLKNLSKDDKVIVRPHKNLHPKFD